LRSLKRTGQYHRYCPVFFVSASAHVPEVRSLRFAPVRPKPASTGCRGPRLTLLSQSCILTPSCSEGSKSSFHYSRRITEVHRMSWASRLPARSVPEPRSPGPRGLLAYRLGRSQNRGPPDLVGRLALYT